MRNSIERYKESLSRIASDVLDAAQELDIPEAQPQSDVPAFSARRRSSRFTPPPLANGTDPGSHDEIAKYKERIQKLQASEAEIKALSFNYAAMLKEKEEQLSKLREENGSLKKNLEGVIEQVPSRPQNNAFQGNSSSGNHLPKYSVFKKDGFNNGTSEADPFDGMRRKSAISQGNEKEHEDLVEEIRNLMEVKARNESEIKILIAQLENERENSSTIKLKLQEEHKLNESSQKELHGMKVEKERIFTEIKELQKELHEKISELERVQMELNRRNMEEERNESLESLKNDILTLEKENAKLKVEKNELETNMKHHMKSAVEKTSVPDTKSVYKDMSKISEVTNKMTVRMQKLEETLKDTCKERDKALQELARLKQHLLDKELEDSDKMDEDSKVIEELRATAEYQRAHIVQLEKTLKQEIVKREDLKKLASDEHQKSNEVINELNQKLASCMSIVHSKNVELQNLQTALGQFYAESEAKERLGRDLTLAREESNKLSESLKVANHGLELCKREKEEIFAKLSHAERMLLDGTRTIQKMEEENTKLRGALEQSMMRVNRMSLDSDNSVDRRIVIKLLVTYFQRNHSKEVLDLMVRMLGFSDEDKKRIGFAQNTTGKGVVRGVLGLPGRLVGGILGGSSPEDPSKSPDNQSFADLWVDFLLKETEERERRESKEAARMSSITQESSTSSTSKSVPELGTKLPSSIGFPSTHYKANHFSGPTVTKEQQSFEEHLDAEFATVPLKSSVSPSAVSAFSRLPPKY